MKYKKVQTPDLFRLVEIKTNDSHPHAYKPHLHSELSLGIIEKGQTMLEINNKDYQIEEGDAIIILPKTVHNCKPVDIENWAFSMFYFDKALFGDILDNLDENIKIGICRLGPSEFHTIKKLCNKLTEEKNAFVQEVEIISILSHILDNADIKITFPDTAKIKPVRTYIENHFLDELDLTTLSEKFNINKYSLIRKFRKEYNTTPSAYQLQLKVDYAKQIIHQKNCLADTALDAGFYDQAHFTREFRKATGVTPLAYLKSIK
jgi:AraC-like DNA-binding protein